MEVHVLDAVLHVILHVEAVLPLVNQHVVRYVQDVMIVAVLHARTIVPVVV